MTKIKETKEVVEFFVRLLNWISYALEDKKVEFVDVLALAPSVLAARAAFENLDEIPKEISHLSEKDKDDLINFIRDELDLEDDMIEGKIEYTVQLALELVRFCVWIKEKKAKD